MAVVVAEQVSLWGIPLLADECSDVILLKFLRARDFKVKEAFAMLWHGEKSSELRSYLRTISEVISSLFMHGVDKEGHPGLL